MKRKIYVVFIFLLASLSTQAQFGKMLKNKAKSALEKKVKTTDNSSSNTSNDSNTNNDGIAESSSSSNVEKKKTEISSKVVDNGLLYLSYTFGMSSGVNNYAVNQVKLSRQMTDLGDNVDILPVHDLEYPWLRFLTTPELEMMSPEGYIGYELVSGSYVTKIGPDRSQTMELGTGMPVLTRGMLIAEDIFVIYAGSHQGGHAFNVPSYMDQEDITIMNIVGKGEQQFHLDWLEKAKPIVKEFEATLKANYDKAAKASLASIKMPKAGSMNANSALKNFATTKVKETIAKDGAQLLKLNIESNDWSIVKNKYTGRILYRWIKGSFTAKDSHGYFNIAPKVEYVNLKEPSNLP